MGRKLRELTIKDDFMFGAVMSDPENCRELLEMILGISIDRIEVSKEKSMVYHPEYTLDFVRRKVNRKMAWLQHHYPQAKSDYETLKEEMIALGVTPESTYLYIQGHTLFESVVMPLLNPVCTVLRKEREKEIRRLAEHDVQRQNELSCYQHSQQPVDDMLRKNVNFKNSAPFQRLRNDIAKLMQRIDKESADLAQNQARQIAEFSQAEH